MKRITALLLALIMVSALFAGCETKKNGDGTVSSADASTDAPTASEAPTESEAPTDSDTGTEVPPAPTEIKIDLNGYKIIRHDAIGSELLSSITDFKKTVEEKCGITLAIGDDFVKRDETEPEDAKEIVIGKTERKASVDTLAGLTGCCYAIRQVGQRIIITGTDDSKIIAAVEYFFDKYVSTADGSIIKAENTFDYTSEPVELLEIINKNKSEFTVVYQDGLDSTTSSTDTSDRRDVEVEWTLEIVNKINGFTGERSVAPATDWYKKGTVPDSSKYEILVGFVSRPELETVKETLALNEYTVTVIGHKIVVFGWNMTTLRLAVDMFERLFSSGKTVDADKKIDFTLSADFSLKGRTDIWLTDIPEFEGGTLDRSYDADKGVLGIRITETDEAAYLAYRKKLESAGYTLYLENTLGGNKFATYTKDGGFIHVYYVAYEKAVRIVTDKTCDVMPQTTPGEYTKICETSLTQMKLNYAAGNFGMCYVITLEDGSFIIYDGGGSTGSDHVALFNLLKKLNKREDGIHIAAWVLTHAHWDHRSVFTMFAEAYRDQFTLEMFVMNTMSKYEMYNGRDIDESGTSAIPATVKMLKAKLLIVHTGQYFYVRNVRFDVIYTHEDLYPTGIEYFNNSSTVTRLTIGEQTVTFLGDIMKRGSEVIVKMYGSDVASDIVQVSHHGESGGTLALYKALSPKVLLWPASKTSYTNRTSTAQTTNEISSLDYQISHNIGVIDVIVADDFNYTIEFPFVPGSGKIIEN